MRAANATGEAVDLILLREAICNGVETANHPYAEWAKGDGNKARRKDPNAWGVCQIHYDTAVEIGGLLWLEQVGGFPAVFAALGNKERAYETADNILRWCVAVKKRRTVKTIAMCFNSPSIALVDASPALGEYAARVEAAYKARRSTP